MNDLPRELLFKILDFLSKEDKQKIPFVCKLWRDIYNDHYFKPGTRLFDDGVQGLVGESYIDYFNISNDLPLKVLTKVADGQLITEISNVQFHNSDDRIINIATGRDGSSNMSFITFGTEERDALWAPFNAQIRAFTDRFLPFSYYPDYSYASQYNIYGTLNIEELNNFKFGDIFTNDNIADITKILSENVIKSVSYVEKKRKSRVWRILDDMRYKYAIKMHTMI